MISLTTVQRDLLQLLLTAQGPLSAAALGQQFRMTPRQVSYTLREIRGWLERHQVSLRSVAGLGFQVLCSPEQKRRLLAELAAQPRFQLVLTPSQRQQLLALQLLAASQPLILQQFQDDLAVARATVLKDLDTITPWLGQFGLTIARRQHRGFWIEGPEGARRQLLAAIAWGDVPFSQPLLAMYHGRGVAFTLTQDAALLPIVGRVDNLVEQWDLASARHCTAAAERELGGRFTDEAVELLALACAIQAQRVAAGQTIDWPAETMAWIQAQVVWPVASRIGAQLWPDLPATSLAAETAAFAIQLGASARDQPWRSDLGSDTAFLALIAQLLACIAQTYAMPELADDQLLRDGLEAHILPACLRERFQLWAPPRPMSDTHTERYRVERDLAAKLAADVQAAVGTPLPPDALDDLILLLRAAVVRARPDRARRVLVVCPSGMATTQLLLARLKARFPRLGAFEVLSMRELTPQRVAEADLIVSTVPLSLPFESPIAIIQVHPMLKPEDVAALTQWMA